MKHLFFIPVFIPVLFLSLLAVGCTTPQEGKDKSLAGAVLGAGWGAGAGAVVGNQVADQPAGEGAAIGAGFGLVSGALSGLMYDSVEDDQIRQQRELTVLTLQNRTNAVRLAKLQGKLDRALLESTPGMYQVYFDPDATHLRTGAIQDLEVIGEQLKTRTNGYRVHVVGHTDDSGKVEYNERLALSRARAVTGYLAARGISLDDIIVESHGAERPVASNVTATGRQMNRRVDVYVLTK